MDGSLALSGVCSGCGATLARAIVREIRHYEETRLLEVTCAACERTFLAITQPAASANALQIEDVATAAGVLARARSLRDLFPSSDLDAA
jgi:hypothetical protein